MNQVADELARAQDALGSHDNPVHTKAARRLLQLCHDNKGVYIKVGQHLANLDYIVPREYIQVLSVLFDSNPQMDYETIRMVVREDFGRPLEEVFDEFDPEPIASASLAQVHVAREKKTGRKLAVKVQHCGLRETSAGDLFALVTAVRIAQAVWSNFSWGWLADEMAPQLSKELDFCNEGRNAERAAENLKSAGIDNVVIPKVVWQHTTSRVLTMHFEEGFKATDVAAIQKAGLKERDVARLISSVFASQVFLSKWVHCDPHPANVLLRANTGKPQMVLVDHGLYRELESAFTLHYASLWKALMLADLDAIKSSCHELGVDQAYTLFAAMLTARPFDELMERSKQKTLRQQDAGNRADHAIISGYAQRYLSNIFDLLNTLPRQMLLLLKMNDCLRHIDQSLGSPTNTLVISGKFAARSIYEGGVYDSRLERLQSWWSYMQVLLRIKVHDLAVWWFDTRSTMRRLIR
jgi:aarF domain-containing kinase